MKSNKIKRAENVEKSLNKYIQAINTNFIPSDAKKLLSTANEKKVASFHKKDANSTPAIISGGINLNDNKKEEKNNNKNDLNKYNKVTVKTKNSKQAMRFLKEQLKNLSR